MPKSLCFWIIAVYLICPAGLGSAADDATKDPDLAKPAVSFASGSERPSEDMLTLLQAREYMLSLINRDRATANLPPVELDQTACAAAQLHSDTMANLHFNSHWHPDGKLPPQRYSELGGFDYVMENSHGTHESPPFVISVPEKQLFTKHEIEEEENCYFGEKPPNDGHRKNILMPEHTHVGLGLTLIEQKVKYDPDAEEKVCRDILSSQEFINKRAGRFSQSDTVLHKGKTYILSGELDPGVNFYEFQLAWDDAPQAIPLDILKDSSQPQYHGGYTLPAHRLLDAFPPPYSETPSAKVNLDGRRFACEITPEKGWHAGLYSITIWAKMEGASNAVPISLHTIMLE